MFNYNLQAVDYELSKNANSLFYISLFSTKAADKGKKKSKNA